MVLRLVELFPEVAVENGGSSEATSLVSVGVTPSSHMMPGVNEFKVFVIRRPEKIPQPVRFFHFPILIKFHLIVDSVLMLGAVKWNQRFSELVPAVLH